MNFVKAIQHQSLMDIAIQELGSVDAVFDIAIANQISITDLLIPGQQILIPNSTESKKDKVEYFKGKQRKIATNLSNENFDLIIASQGIGSMIIENDFIVE